MIFDIINWDPGFMRAGFLDHLKAPGVHSFIPVDSKGNFAVSLEKKPEDWYYRTNKVEYTLNSERFRTKEFKDIDWKNSIVLLGCSCTFGTGVTDDDTIAAYLQRITGKYVVNLGQIAASNSAIAYNSYYLKEHYPTPLAVVNIWTNIHRWFWICCEEKNKHLMFELLDNKLLCKGNDSIDMTDPKSRRITKHKVVSEVTNNILYMKMSNALWKDHPNHLQLARYDYYKDGEYLSMVAKVFPEVIQLNPSWEEDRSARDNQHWGREINEKIAKLIASNLKL